MSYYRKYLKYKSKYLELKQLKQKGGGNQISKMEPFEIKLSYDKDGSLLKESYPDVFLLVQDTMADSEQFKKLILELNTKDVPERSLVFFIGRDGKVGFKEQPVKTGMCTIDSAPIHPIMYIAEKLVSVNMHTHPKACVKKVLKWQSGKDDNLPIYCLPSYADITTSLSGGIHYGNTTFNCILGPKYMCFYYYNEEIIKEGMENGDRKDELIDVVATNANNIVTEMLGKESFDIDKLKKKYLNILNPDSEEIAIKAIEMHIVKLDEFM